MRGGNLLLSGTVDRDYFSKFQFVRENAVNKRKIDDIHQGCGNEVKRVFDHMHWNFIITWGFPNANVLQIFSSSLTVVGFRVISMLLLQVRNEQRKEFTALSTYQIRTKIGEIFTESVSNVDRIRYGLAFRFKRRWERRLTLSLVSNFFNNFQVNLRSFFSLSNFLS